MMRVCLAVLPDNTVDVAPRNSDSRWKGPDTVPDGGGSHSNLEQKVNNKVGTDRCRYIKRIEVPKNDAVHRAAVLPD